MVSQDKCIEAELVDGLGDLFTTVVSEVQGSLRTTRQEATSGGADQTRNADLELVTDVEEQAVLLLWPQVVYGGLDAGVSTIASEGQVGAVIAGGPEAVQMSVNVVDVEECDVKDPVPAAALGFKSVELHTVVATDHGGVGGY